MDSIGGDEADRDLLAALVLGPPAEAIGKVAAGRERESQEKAKLASERLVRFERDERMRRRFIAFLAPLIIAVSALAVVLLPDVDSIQNGNFFLFGEGAAVDLLAWATDRLTLAWYLVAAGTIACLLCLAIGPRLEALFVITALALGGAAAAAATPVVAVLSLMLANIIVYVGTVVLVVAIIFGMLIAYASSK